MSHYPSRHGAFVNTTRYVCHHDTSRLFSRHVETADKTRRFLSKSTIFLFIITVLLQTDIWQVVEDEAVVKIEKIDPNRPSDRNNAIFRTSGVTLLKIP